MIKDKAKSQKKVKVAKKDTVKTSGDSIKKKSSTA